MKKWLEEISEKYKAKTVDINPISEIDCKIFEVVLEILELKGKEVSDLSVMLDQYKKVKDVTLLNALLGLAKEIEKNPEYNYFVDVYGTQLPLKAIKTIKEHNEYDYEHSKPLYYIVINEQHEGQPTVFSNLRIKCQSEDHRETLLENLRSTMSKFNVKIITV